MTITNQTNPIGSSYTSKKSRILAPREGNLLVQETSFTTLRLTKTSNNPPTYRKEVFQHASAKDEGNVVQIGVVKDDGKIEFNSQLDTGKANEEFFKRQIEKQVKTQTIDAEKQIKKLINPEKRGIDRKRSRRTLQEDDSKDSPKKVEPSNKGIATTVGFSPIVSIADEKIGSKYSLSTVVTCILFIWLGDKISIEIFVVLLNFFCIVKFCFEVPERIIFH